LSVWANATSNSTLTSLLKSAVQSTTTFPTWTLTTGIISEGNSPTSLQSILKAIYVRGLTEAYHRNPGTDLASYIESFITVQYNSLQSTSRQPGTDFYETSWFGPANATLNTFGNLAALDVLNAEFSFVAQNSSGPSTPLNDTSGSNGDHNGGSPSSSSSLGAIVGGVVGGVVAITAVAVSVFFCHRRRKQRSNAPIHEKYRAPGEDFGAATEPFLTYSDAAGDSSYVNISHDPSTSTRIPEEPTSAGQFVNQPPGRLTVGHTSSKLALMNASGGQQGSTSNMSYPPAPASSGDASTSVSNEQSNRNQTTQADNVGDLPGLVQRLNQLLQMRGPVHTERLPYSDEMPPQYESTADAR